jgi:hypothetical protein
LADDENFRNGAERNEEDVAKFFKEMGYTDSDEIAAESSHYLVRGFSQFEL